MPRLQHSVHLCLDSIKVVTKTLTGHSGSGRTMRRLEDTSADTGSGHEDGEGSDYISFGVLVLALSVGIFTRVTIAKWIP